MNSKERQILIQNCQALRCAYENQSLGYMKMPEDENPGFKDEEHEQRLVYFTLPMSLNYQRNSYTLWEAALKTYIDKDTKVVFDVQTSATLTPEKLREYLIKYKLALQPNKHIATWQKISQTIFENWGSIEHLLKAANHDYLQLQTLVQKEYKKGFPYLSGPKIFNYWCFILKEYGQVSLSNFEYIEIAPDTHITQCSVRLGVITQEEAGSLPKDQVSLRWRKILKGSGIHPIDMHPPLWFWSRNNFQFQLPKCETKESVQNNS